MVNRANDTLRRVGTHAKLAHDHWTGPWRVVEVVQPSFSQKVEMSGR